MNVTMKRRNVVLFALALVLTGGSGCKREARCKNCGMRIDPASSWRSELVSVDGAITTFDTPRCALQSWRSGKTQAKSLRVVEYYDRTWRDGAEVRFILGGDVVGPMGPDLVPVSSSRVTKFIQDHAADRALTLEEVTLEVLDSVSQRH